MEIAYNLDFEKRIKEVITKMFSNNYIRTQKRLEFHQKYPSLGVKCSFCTLIFSLQQIEHHISTHISPHFMTPSTLPSNIKKLSKPRLFLDQKQNPLGSSGFKSMNHSQIPKEQKIRNQRFVPETKKYEYKQIERHNQKQVSKIQHRNKETNFQVSDVTKEALEMENIQQTLKLNGQQVMFHKPKLNTYQGQKLKSKIHHYTSQSFHPKKQANQQNSIAPSKRQCQTSPIYQILQARVAQTPSILNLFQPISLNHSPIKKLSIPLTKYLAPTLRSPSISTKKQINNKINKTPSQSFLARMFSCEGGNTNQGEIILAANTSTTQSFNKTMNRSASTNNLRNTCNDCGGFYCKACNSSIPPQYRPNAMINGQDQKTKRFYQQFIYKQTQCSQCK